MPKLFIFALQQWMETHISIQIIVLLFHIHSDQKNAFVLKVYSGYIGKYYKKNTQTKKKPKSTPSPKVFLKNKVTFFI